MMLILRWLSNISDGGALSTVISYMEVLKFASFKRQDAHKMAILDLYKIHAAR